MHNLCFTIILYDLPFISTRKVKSSYRLIDWLLKERGQVLHKSPCWLVWSSKHPRAGWWSCYSHWFSLFSTASYFFANTWELTYLLALLQVASFLLYLSDVEEGGETMFPYEVGRGSTILFHSCFLLTCSFSFSYIFIFCRTTT